MLTVDTHHVDGWVCDLCADEYPEKVANVIACADNQIADFIRWCRQQPWYSDTVIVIQGDHPRMDSNSLVDNVNEFDRTIYNCFINTGFNKAELSTSNRVFTTLDMFPTILAAMGFFLPEDRLGLGTDMFSNKETFAEEFGYNNFQNELIKYSQYYIDHFW